MAALLPTAFLIHSHSQAQHYQKQINSQFKQLEQQKQKEDNDLQLKLQEKDKQIDELKAQVSLKKQREASLAVVSSRVAINGNCNDYRGLVAQYGWNTSVAMAIMQAESGCNPTASSPTHDHGLMQINEVHLAMVDNDVSKLNDPATNVRVAYAIYSDAGWRAWSTYTNGAYQRYL